MKQSDAKMFNELLAGVHSFYGKELSVFAGEVWRKAMQPFDFEAVKDAMNRHCVSPDTGQWMPKPADIIRMLQGTSVDSAMVAWAKVDRAIREVGPYATVVFDDALVHRVLDDMGGWIPLGQKTDDEWPFIGNEFRTRYAAYRSRQEMPAYPPSLLGIAERDSGANGFSYDKVRFVGDPERARAVLRGGSDRPALSFVGMRALPSPDAPRETAGAETS